MYTVQRFGIKTSNYFLYKQRNASITTGDKPEIKIAQITIFELGGQQNTTIVKDKCSKKLHDICSIFIYAIAKNNLLQLSYQMTHVDCEFVRNRFILYIYINQLQISGQEHFFIDLL